MKYISLILTAALSLMVNNSVLAYFWTTGPKCDDDDVTAVALTVHLSPKDTNGKFVEFADFLRMTDTQNQ